MGVRAAQRLAFTTGAATAMVIAAGLVPMFAGDAEAEAISTGFFLYLAPGASGSAGNTAPGKMLGDVPTRATEQGVNKSSLTGSATHRWFARGFGDGFALSGSPSASIHVNVAGTSVGLTQLSLAVSLKIGANTSDEEDVDLRTGNQIVNVTFNFTNAPGVLTNSTIELVTEFSGASTNVRFRVNGTATPSHVFLPRSASGDGGDGGGGNETGNDTDNETGNDTDEDEFEECPPEGENQGDEGQGNQTGNGTGNGTGNESGNDTGNGTGNGTGNETGNETGNGTEGEECPEPPPDGSDNETDNGTGNETGNQTGNDTGTNRTGRGRFPLSDLDEEGEFLSAEDDDGNISGREKKEDKGIPGFGAVLPAVAALVALAFVAVRRKRKA